MRGDGRLSSPRPPGGAIRVIALAALLATGPATRADELAVGMCAAFTGPGKELAVDLRAGIEVAFAAANVTGGVRGRRVKLVTYDDHGDPRWTQAGLAQLLDTHHVRALLGSGGPATTDAMVAFANQRRLPLLGALSTASALWADPPDRYVFTYRPSWSEEAAAIVHHLVEVKRIDPAHIAVFAEEGATGDETFEAVARAIRRLRLDASGLVRIGYRPGTADVAQAVKTVRRSGGGRIRGVVVGGTFVAAARLIEKLRDARMDVALAVSSLVGSSELAEELAQLGPDYGRGLFVTQVVPNPSTNAAILVTYREQLRRFAPGERPGFLSLEGWLLGRIFLEALGRAGEPTTSEGLVDALESLRALDLGTGASLGFGPSDHHASHKIWGTVMDGRGGFAPVVTQ